ncbi:uncharacterized protein LOC130713817 isoform X2 [Lotus japonicus]|uniref:uncharacterized protein LOC130713817 isoform X2 n=1 Tax=Lotus japonicus TaxID=34305 RepID=UPI00258AF369|nr:uncharacterized protein LOC130713817 isoform X2 [Lotus japonicus]
MENEFKYRAIDKRPQPQPPPLPPPQQSAYPHSAATYFSEGPLGGEGGYARMVPPTMSVREEIERAVEKERIRREIITEEMARARRRELEEEVRRELGIPMQRSLVPPPPPPQQRFLVVERVKLAIEDMPVMPPPQPRILDLAEIETAKLPDQYRERVNLRLNPKLNQVAIEDMPQPRFMDITEIKPANNHDEVIQLAKPNPGVYDAKRKAAEPAVNETQFGLMKKPKKAWRCELCGVSTTDERGLNMHLSGKKHKAKEAQRAEKIGLDAKPDIQTHHALVEGGMTQNNVDAVEGETIITTTSGLDAKPDIQTHLITATLGFDAKPDIQTHHALVVGGMTQNNVDAVEGETIISTTSGLDAKPDIQTHLITATLGLDAKPDIQTHHALVVGGMTQNNVDAVEGAKEEQAVQKSQSMGVSEIKEVSTKEAGKTNAFVGRKRKFWCDICGISTLSQGVMENHKRGRKHRRRMENTMSQNNGCAPHTSSADNFSCSEKVHLVAGSKEDTVDEGL